jgi:hypothetical protein
VDKNTLFCAAAVPLSGYFWDIIKNWRCFCDEEVSMSFFFLGKKVLIFKISGSRKWNGEVWMWLYGVAIYKQKKKKSITTQIEFSIMIYKYKYGK